MLQPARARSPRRTSTGWRARACASPTPTRPRRLCAPTRYAVATGNYTWRGRLPGGTWGWNQTPQFLPGQKTVGHLLQEAGYRTGLFGKLHFGGDFENE